MKRYLTVSTVVFFAVATVFIGTHHAVGAEEAGFQCLFDGKTLNGWEGKTQFWSVQDGAITGQTTKDNPTKGNTFLIWRGGKTADFELRLDFRIVGGNSGIQYRSEEKGDFVVGVIRPTSRPAIATSGFSTRKRAVAFWRFAGTRW